MTAAISEIKKNKKQKAKTTFCDCVKGRGKYRYLGGKYSAAVELVEGIIPNVRVLCSKRLAPDVQRGSNEASSLRHQPLLRVSVVSIAMCLVG